MKLPITILLLTAAVAASCTESSRAPAPLSHKGPLLLVPLSVGARWSGTIVDPLGAVLRHWSREVTRDTIIEGERWYCVTVAVDEDTLWHDLLWTNRPDGFWEDQLHPGNPLQPQQILKYPAAVGDIFDEQDEFSEDDLWYRRFLGDTSVTTPLGTFECLQYVYYFGGLPRQYMLVAPEIGIVTISFPEHCDWVTDSYTRSGSDE